MSEQKTKDSRQIIGCWIRSHHLEILSKISHYQEEKPKRVGKVLWTWAFLNEFSFTVPDEWMEIISERMNQVRTDWVDLKASPGYEKYLLLSSDMENGLKTLKSISLSRFTQVTEMLLNEDPQATLDECDAWLKGDVRSVLPSASESLKRPFAEIPAVYCETEYYGDVRDLCYEEMIRLRKIGPRRASSIRFNPRRQLTRDALEDLVNTLSRVTNRYEARENENLHRIHSSEGKAWDFEQFVILSCVELWREIYATRKLSGWKIRNEFPWADEIKRIQGCSERCFLFQERLWAYSEAQPTNKEHKELDANTHEHYVGLCKRRDIVEKKIVKVQEHDGFCRTLYSRHGALTSSQIPKDENLFYDQVANENFGNFCHKEGRVAHCVFLGDDSVMHFTVNPRDSSDGLSDCD